MVVNLQQNIDREKVDRIPWIKGSYLLGYVDSSMMSRLGMIYEIEAEDCKKIKSLFKGKVERDIVKGDRVFVLPGCKIPQFKIKDFLRGVGAVMTSDIKDATVFVGNDRVFQEHSAYDAKTLDSLSMILELTYCLATCDGGMLEVGDINNDPVIQDYYKPLENVIWARFTKLMASRNHEGVEIGGTRQMFGITPYAAMLSFEILSKQIPTINEDCLLRQLPAAAVLNRTLFDEVMKMLNSKDEANNKVAHEILANCDYSDSDLYLYQIARKHYYQIRSSRYKNVRLFVSESKLTTFYSMGEEAFVKMMYKKNRLTKEALDYALPIISSRFYNNLDRIKSSIFQVKVELRPELSSITGEHDYNKEVELVALTTNSDD